jgi:hypothetical protein
MNDITEARVVSSEPSLHVRLRFQGSLIMVVALLVVRVRISTPIVVHLIGNKGFVSRIRMMFGADSRGVLVPSRSILRVIIILPTTSLTVVTIRAVEPSQSRVFSSLLHTVQQLLHQVRIVSVTERKNREINTGRVPQSSSSIPYYSN